jgi:catechol 2,3-dioxygenase-like lactoylglutathione lyase family enzyme
MLPEAGRIEFSFTELRVADWTRAVRWYVDVLGLRASLEDVAHQFALLEAGGGRLGLKGGGSPADAPGNARLVFRVPDVDAERERLLGLGVSVGPPCDNRREGYRGVSLLDPGGTPITLFSWLEGATEAL